MTIGYAATGKSPFGTGESTAILYRIVYGDPDIAAVPGPLRPLVEAALVKDPQSRPSAHELLDRLTSTSITRTSMANGSLLLEPAGSAPPGTGPRRTRRVRISRRMAAIGGSAVAIVAAAVILTTAMLTGTNPKAGSPVANVGGAGAPTAPATASLPAYPGQQQRGVFQTIYRIVASGDTMVTTGSQTSDGVIRQQFFVSPDGGKTWHLAPVHTPGGGQPPLGYAATRIAGGSRGWVAAGPNAIWTSRDGLSWTLAATHGITPQQHGDSVFVVTSTPDGFLAGGQQTMSGGVKQAVTWISRDGVTWQRLTAAQLGLLSAGQTPASINYATSQGNDTLISDGVSAWLSTDGGSAWTPVTIPVDHGAENSISGVASDASGLIAVRPGRSASGAPDGVSYFFAPNGPGWQYAGTIDAAGGWSPGVVKGSNYGFVVTGKTTAGQIVAYTSTGTGATWLPAGSLGDSSSEATPSATIGPGRTVVAVGSANATKVSQQAVFLEANTAGNVRSVSLAGIAGGIIPEVSVTSTAVAGGEQIAVGAADGYPAVWRRAADGSWALVSSLSLVSADSGGSAGSAGSAPGLAALTSVTHGQAGWLAVGTPGPVILTSADGATWRPAGSIARDLGGVAAVAAASGPAGYVITGKLAEPDGSFAADLWWSRNLTSWTKAHEVNDTTGSSQVLAVAAGPRGFVSAGSLDSKPAVWTTADGLAWTAIVLELPQGASTAVIQQVAINGKSVVALGQATTASGTVPLAELSTNGGTSWRQVPFSSPGPGPAFTALTAGSGGFTAAAQFGVPGQQDAAVWTSATGANWTRSTVSGLTGGGNHDIAALAASGSAVTGIDSVRTQQGQQFVTLSLPAR